MINSYPIQNLYQPNAGAKAAAGSRLSVFYINDMHGNIDNMSGMLAASDKFDIDTKKSGADALKLSAGDNFSGGDEKKDKLVVNLLNRMGINASAVGNHEFDATISAFYKFLNPDKTKFLAANADTPQNSEFYSNVQKSTVVDINGNQYGLIGLMPFDLETVTGGDATKTEGIRVFDMEKSAEIVNSEVKNLQDKGINKIILVSHIGNDNDKKIAPKLHGVDIIVGGHSHTEVNGVVENENLLKNADNDPVVIVQTGENAKNIGILNVEFDEKGVPSAIDNNLIKTNQEKTVVINYLKDAVMGKSPEIGHIQECDPLPDNRRITPCAWTNLMCDAMKSETGTDIAFINASNTRKTPKQGVLTERDVTETTPLKNTLLVKKITEKEVVKAIKDALATSFASETGEPGILHTSGLSYKADTKGNLLELNFVDKDGNKTPIDINNPSDKVYTACYDSFVAAGTEYPVFVPNTMTHKEILQTMDFDKDKLLMKHIEKLPNKNDLSVKDDHRIEIIKEDGTLLTATDNAASAKNNEAAKNTETSDIETEEPSIQVARQTSSNQALKQGSSLATPADMPVNAGFNPMQAASLSPLLISRIQSYSAAQTYGQIA